MSSNIEITGDRLQCLRPGAWLNDEVILFVYYLFICLSFCSELLKRIIFDLIIS